jgi:hypothetical protein
MTTHPRPVTNKIETFYRYWFTFIADPGFRIFIFFFIAHLEIDTCEQNISLAQFYIMQTHITTYPIWIIFSKIYC